MFNYLGIPEKFTKWFAPWKIVQGVWLISCLGVLDTPRTLPFFTHAEAVRESHAVHLTATVEVSESMTSVVLYSCSRRSCRRYAFVFWWFTRDTARFLRSFTISTIRAWVTGNGRYIEWWISLCLENPSCGRVRTYIEFSSGGVNTHIELVSNPLQK